MENFNKTNIKNLNTSLNFGDWGLGIGDWGWGLGIGPNPQSPIPNPLFRNIFIIIKFN